MHQVGIGYDIDTTVPLWLQLPWISRVTEACIHNRHRPTLHWIIRQISTDAEKAWTTEIARLIRFNKLCAWRHNMLPPLQVDNIFVFIRQVAPIPACWLFKTSATRWPFDLESGVRVTCDVGYLHANFSLSRPLCSRVRPDVRDRQTNVRQKHR